jgi:hypothetical protein
MTDSAPYDPFMNCPPAHPVCNSLEELIQSIENPTPEQKKYWDDLDKWKEQEKQARIEATKSLKERNLSNRCKPSERVRSYRGKVKVADLARPSIYLLFEDDKVVYVGQSINPYERLVQHLRSKRFTHIRIMSCNQRRLRYWEDKLIKAYRPFYNVALNCGRS